MDVPVIHQDGNRRLDEVNGTNSGKAGPTHDFQDLSCLQLKTMARLRPSLPVSILLAE